MANEKITAFATAVGSDIKAIKQDVAAKVGQSEIDTAVAAVKKDILGEAVPENLDTLKEIVDSLSSAGGDSVAAVTGKMTELGQRIDAVEQVDPLAAYNAAKA